MSFLLGISELKEIKGIMTQSLKEDYNSYVFSFFRRRIDFLFDQLNIRRKEHFFQSIQDNEFKEKIRYHFPVPYTEVFRDPSFWKYLKSKIIPILGNTSQTIWLPHNPSAEELFSLLVLLRDMGQLENFEIICNVTSKTRLEELKNGLIIEKNIDLNKQNFKRTELLGTFDDYFKEEGSSLKISTSLLKKVTFIPTSYNIEQPQNEVACIIFRYALLYRNEEEQSRILTLLHSKLKNNGFFAIGIKEKSKYLEDGNLMEFDKDEQIFSKSKINFKTC